MGRKSRAEAERKGGPPAAEDPRLYAALDLLRRTGLCQFQLRYSDSELPVVWLAVGTWKVDGGARPIGAEGPRLNERGRKVMVERWESFVEQHGREPAAGDFTFFDPDTDQPEPMTQAQADHIRAVVNAHTAHEAAAALDPLTATLRLLEKVLDGGQCKYCRRPSAVTEHWQSQMPLSDTLCWYVYDPETERYRRSCEGDTE